MPKCLDCEGELDVPEDPKIGEILTCSSCLAEHEIKKINEDGSLEIEELIIEGEDWGE